MIYQTDPKNNFIVQHFGCYLFDLFKITQDIRGEDWDFAKVSDLYQKAMKAKLVGYLVGEVFYPGENTNPPQGCFVQDAAGVLELAGAPTFKILMGPLPAGMWTARDRPASSIPDKTSIIQKWHNDWTGFSHFVVGNTDGSVKWDPIHRGPGLGSVTVAEGRLVSMRLIQFV